MSYTPIEQHRIDVRRTDDGWFRAHCRDCGWVGCRMEGTVAALDDGAVHLLAAVPVSAVRS